MAADSVYRNLEDIHGGQQRLGVGGKFSNVDSRHVMQAIDRVDGTIGEQTVFDHPQSAVPRFFGRLEDKVNGTIEIGMAG